MGHTLKEEESSEVNVTGFLCSCWKWAMFKQSCLMCLSCTLYDQTLFLKIRTKSVTASWNLYSLVERQVVNSKHTK